MLKFNLHELMSGLLIIILLNCVLIEHTEMET